MKKTKFVVLTTQRSGSSWLLDLFTNCKNTEGHGELFYPYRRKKPAKSGFDGFSRHCETDYNGISQYRPFTVLRYLSDLYSRPADNIGFKLHYSDVKAHPEICLGLLLNRVAIVHLVRGNSLDIVISEQMALITGKSHITKKSEQRIVKVHIPAEKCLKAVIALERKKKLMRFLFKLLFRKYLEVSYEELSADVAKFKSVVRFLEINEVNELLTTALVKRQTRDHPEILENYNEIEEILVQNGMSHFLRD